MSPRLIIKAAEWTLTEDTRPGARKSILRVLCITCGEQKEVYGSEPDSVEIWAIEHTGLNTQHREFKINTEWYWIVEPSPGNPLYEMEKEE